LNQYCCIQQLCTAFSIKRASLSRDGSNCTPAWGRRRDTSTRRCWWSRWRTSGRGSAGGSGCRTSGGTCRRERARHLRRTTWNRRQKTCHPRRRRRRL